MWPVAKNKNGSKQRQFKNLKIRAFSFLLLVDNSLGHFLSFWKLNCEKKSWDLWLVVSYVMNDDNENEPLANKYIN